MNGEILLDAMNHLDDDLIESTGELRGRKSKPYWLGTVAAAAACLCLFLFTGNDKLMAPEAADMNGNPFYGSTDEMKMESAVEAPMESVASNTSVLCITEVGDQGFSGIVQDADGDNVQILTISCDTEITVGLRIGDLVRITYEIGSENRLLELEWIAE